MGIGLGLEATCEELPGDIKRDDCDEEAERDEAKDLPPSIHSWPTTTVLISSFLWRHFNPQLAHGRSEIDDRGVLDR